MRPLIVLTNDDGIRSPGILAAAAAVADLGELLIVAPATQQTGMGRGAPKLIGGRVTIEVLQVNDRAVDAYAVPGSPAQATMYGVIALAPRRPDLLISGVNFGENLGTAVTASGTVGAALEAASLGVPGLAVSLETIKAYHYAGGANVSWEAAAHFTRVFAESMLAQKMPFDVDVLNVNVPDDATPQTPWRITTQSRQPYFEAFRTNLPVEDPGSLDYTMTVHWDTLEPGSDIQVFAGDRAVSVTPLSLDLTSRTDLAALEGALRSRSRG